jgi:hypothetical protein
MQQRQGRHIRPRNERLPRLHGTWAILSSFLAHHHDLEALAAKQYSHCATQDLSLNAGEKYQWIAWFNKKHIPTVGFTIGTDGDIIAWYFWTDGICF